VGRLYEVMQEPLEVHGRGNFPTLFICLRRFIRCVMRRLEASHIKVTGVKMNGGAASYVLATKILPFNDIDLIFEVDLSSSSSENGDDPEKLSPIMPNFHNSPSAKFDVIKHSVFDSLIDFLPPDVNRAKINVGSMKTAYVRKMVKVCGVGSGSATPTTPTSPGDGKTPPTATTPNGDVWSLISLNNDFGRFVELKFVERMRRQFEFSVDSFQIDLDPIVKRDRLRSEDVSSEEVDESVQIQAESVFGDFNTALRHLNHMLIDTVNPELIRGGGLLKYVNLLVRGYKPAQSTRECQRMERYMCSRYFIDFSSHEQQQHKLRTYLDTHFQHDLAAKLDYLLMLHRVVDESTVCLMNHELRMSLGAIEQLAFEVNVEMCYEQQLQAAMANMNTTENGETPQSKTCHRCQHQRRPSSAASTLTPSEPNSPSVDGGGSSPAPMCECSSTTSTPEPPKTPARMKPTLLFVPRNASYWIPVM